MKELTILVPKIYPPENNDIVSNELKNIFSKLKLNFKIKIYWIVFQPYEFEEYSMNEYPGKESVEKLQKYFGAR